VVEINQKSEWEGETKAGGIWKWVKMGLLARGWLNFGWGRRKKAGGMDG
jgi:hypothetical protein